eukprot:4138093-Amphidinium_carterae.1
MPTVMSNAVDSSCAAHSMCLPPKVEVVLPILALLTWDCVCEKARTIALAEKSVYSACMRN